MLARNPAGRSHLSAALESAQAVLRRKVIEASGDHVGVVLIGAPAPPRRGGGGGGGGAGGGRPAPEGATLGEVIEGVPHVRTLVPLTDPSVTAIRRLGTLAARVADAEPEAAREALGLAAEDAPLGLALFLREALDIFRRASKSSDFKRIMIFTNDDSPAADARDEGTQIRVNDALTAGVEISVFPVQRPGAQPFDAARFWNGVTTGMDEDPESDE
jgi:hypothetical protein